ncbi:MAG: LutC/YkgG family protein [Desulfurispora sp.]|uniref:LutC/YkgG family protein n=1 Tax=Desulfurispora sp. TaxID=3014275 RepID=UPI00404B54E7
MLQLYDQFKQAAAALSAEVNRVADPQEAVSFCRQFTAELNQPAVVVDSHPMTGQIAASISELTIPCDRQAAARANLGMACYDLAIADTGTLVQNATSLDSRLAATLPPIHLALVPTSGLVPSLVDVFTHLARNSEQLPGYLAFVSGPSRTADIERVLTIGVHGPERLIILFIDRWERG